MIILFGNVSACIYFWKWLTKDNDKQFINEVAIPQI